MPMVAVINALEEDTKQLTDEGLRARTVEFRRGLRRGWKGLSAPTS